MSQIEQLINFIKDTGYKTYDEVKTRAFEINENWREGTWGRGLRRSLYIKMIYKGNEKNSPIIAYKYLKPTEPPKPLPAFNPQTLFPLRQIIY